MKYPRVKMDSIKADVPYAFVGGPFGSNLTTRDYVEEGVPVIRGNNLSGISTFHDDDYAFVSEEKAVQLTPNLAFPGDVIFTQRGTLGQVGVIPSDSQYDRYVISQSQMKLTVHPEKANALYIYYYFRAPDIVQTIINLSLSSGVPHINLGTLKSFEIPLPPLETQRRIVSLLSAYDNLIDNNRRRIDLLEQSARMLYKEWFVSLRFPGHEHVDIKDGAPQGWKKVFFPDVVDFKEGPGLRNYQYRDEGIPFLNIRTIGDDEIDFSKIQHLDETEVGNKYPHFLLQENDHVVSSSGTLGRVVTIRECHLPLMLNTSLIRMRPILPMRLWFLKAYLKYSDFSDQMRSVATGAAQLNFGPVHLKAHTLVLPNASVIDLFEEEVKPMYELIKVLLDMNIKLKQARDLLLPRLMNGEIVV